MEHDLTVGQDRRRRQGPWSAPVPRPSQIGDGPFQHLVGRPMGRGGPLAAPDPVNQPMVRHWAAAFEEHNPVYAHPALG
jgi:hypothetical protein